MNIAEFIKSTGNGVYALVGPAGSGKSTVAQRICELVPCHVMSMDDYFIGDSFYRKQLLHAKQHMSLDALEDACNQFNWWDWDKAQAAIQKASVDHELVLVEGAILGPLRMLSMFEAILWMDLHAHMRLIRLLQRDGHKRTANEVAARFLITQWSENLYYQSIWKYVPQKIRYLGVDNLCVLPRHVLTPMKPQFLPIEMQ